VKPAETGIPIFEGRDVERFLLKLQSRRTRIPASVQDAVTRILSDVRERGDSAVFDCTLRFDGADTRRAGLRLPAAEIKKAAKAAPGPFLELLEKAASNIRRFHEKDKPSSWLSWEEDGVVLGRRTTPLDRVGLYVPGGRAVYPSSLLMAAVPAQVAGVREIAVVSPPDTKGRIHPSILCAAHVLGLDEIYRVGGAQAVGALAFGTESVKPVDKIVGPGNVYVAEAKRRVFGEVDIDMVAGPSEVVLLADASADPSFAAADLLAQAEHDPNASSVCVTHSRAVAQRIQKAVVEQARSLGRQAVFFASLRDWGAVLVTKNMDESLALVNRLAPEHLGLHVEDAWSVLSGVRHAGAVFLGAFSPETVGDYWAGPNHILPTNRTARFSSPLGTADFMKHSSVICYTRQALKKNAADIIAFAKTEGLDGHAEAVRCRTKK
jgi:histidinol dehydrogenase